MSSTALARSSPSISASLSARIPSPSTPSQPSSAKTSASTPQPGTWRHPRLDEIARRQNASVFNGDNVGRVVFNAALLLASIYAPELAYKYTPHTLLALLNSFEPYTSYAVLVARVVLLFNIAIACAPLFRAKDEIEDIPLTPSQRALLGLKPSTTPLTPGQHYITPPRYARSPAPRSSASAQRIASGSPASARLDSPSSLDRSTLAQSKPSSGSPYSSSPLMQRAIGGASAARRLSYGSPSPLDVNTFSTSSTGSSTLGTPTTNLNGGKASVGLNSKWLYERGRASPTSHGLFT